MSLCQSHNLWKMDSFLWQKLLKPFLQKKILKRLEKKLLIFPDFLLYSPSCIHIEVEGQLEIWVKSSRSL